jgi:hypothetical protein
MCAKMLKSTWVIDAKIYVTTNDDEQYVFRRMKEFNALKALWMILVFRDDTAYDTDFAMYYSLYIRQ